MFNFFKKAVKEAVKLEETLEPEIRPKETIYTLKIFFSDGSAEIYSRNFDSIVDFGCIEVYKAFYKWYYLKDSENYTFRYKDGLTVYLRSNIKQINIKRAVQEIN